MLGGLVLIVLVAALSKRTGIASPLLLLVVGIGAGYLPFVRVGTIPPEWILEGVLPPLLYASAVNLPLTDFRRNLQPIVGLAVVLVLVSTAGTGLVLFAVLPGAGLFTALALGAVVSPTDAVAATSIAKRLGLPERIVSVLEGESLLNDATALTLLAAALAAAGSGIVQPGLIALDFGYSVVIAVAIGTAVGWVGVLVRQRLGDPVLTTTISFVVPFAAFFPAEALGASGVLATVVAGIVSGVAGRRRLGGTQRVNDATNWRTVQFVLEQGVFLAMGLQFHRLLDALLASHRFTLLEPVELGALLLVVLLVLRAAYSAVQTSILRLRVGRLLERGDPEPVPEAAEEDGATGKDADRRRRRTERRRADLAVLRQEQPGWRGAVIVTWSGMRGVVTLAAAQSLPKSGLEPLLVLIAFVVAVLSLVGFGGTLPAVIRLLGVQGADDRARRSEFSALMHRIFDAGVQVLDDPEQTEVGGRQADPGVVDRLRERYAQAPLVTDDDAGDAALTERQQTFVLQRRIRDAARTELLDASATGSYSSSTIARAQRLLDTADAREDAASA